MSRHSGRRYVVTGRVQGVGFRYFALRRAEAGGLVGWIRNREDGCVVAEAWGRPESLAEFRTALASGPQFGRVDSVDVVALEDRAELPTRFTVVR